MIGADSAVGLRYAGYFTLSDLTVLLGKPEDLVRDELTKLDIRLAIRFGVEAVPERDVRKLMSCRPTLIGNSRGNQPGYSWSRLRTLMYRAIAESKARFSGQSCPDGSRDRGVCHDTSHRGHGRG